MDKQKLTEMFDTEEKIGVYYTLYGEEEPIDPDAVELGPYDEIESHLPDGFGHFSHCTSCAALVVDRLGAGDVYGFDIKDNPVASEAISRCFGHDFAVVDKRYIVDIWLSTFSGIENQVVFDLQDPEDRAKIEYYYGDPEKWSFLSPGDRGFVSQRDRGFPKDKGVCFPESYGLLGNCVNAFDDDGDCLLNLFDDASDFACVEESSIEVDKQEFLIGAYIRNEEYLGLLSDLGETVFLKHKERGILMAYDQDADIHYFFKEALKEKPKAKNHKKDITLEI